MKEIIYLDTEIVNSLLAQLDQGIISSYTNEQASQTDESITNQSNTGKKSGIETVFGLNTGILPGGELSIKALKDATNDESQISSKGFTEGQRDLLNKIFHDYSLDILLDKLNENDLLSSENLNEGDLTIFNGQFDFYDFSLINAATNPDLWGEIMSWEESEEPRIFTEEQAKKAYTKLTDGKKLTAHEEKHKEEIINNHEHYTGINAIVELMRKLEIFSATAERLFKNLTFIKSNNYAGLLKKEYLRESTEALSFRGNNSRKAIFLGRVIGVKDSMISEHNMDDFSPDEINRIPNALLEILLGSFDILKINDILISPIAIFYESN